MKKVLSCILTGMMLICSIGATSAFAVEPEATKTVVVATKANTITYPKTCAKIATGMTVFGAGLMANLAVVLFVLEHIAANTYSPTLTHCLDEYSSRVAIGTFIATLGSAAIVSLIGSAVSVANYIHGN